MLTGRAKNRERTKNRAKKNNNWNNSLWKIYCQAKTRRAAAAGKCGRRQSSKWRSESSNEHWALDNRLYELLFWLPQKCNSNRQMNFLAGCVLRMVACQASDVWQVYDQRVLNEVGESTTKMNFWRKQEKKSNELMTAELARIDLKKKLKKAIKKCKQLPSHNEQTKN